MRHDFCRSNPVVTGLGYGVEEILPARAAPTLGSQSLDNRKNVDFEDGPIFDEVLNWPGDGQHGMRLCLPASRFPQLGFEIG